MNFLAHLYLSGNNQNIMIGNFMADAIKGNSYQNFEEEIQQGILLHRKIDTFTDQHPIVKQSKRRLNSRYNHFGGIIIDIFYDHFLAKNWTQFSNIPLELYVSEVYLILQKSRKIYPSKLNRLLYFMVLENWLLNYQNTDEIKKVIKIMSHRTKYQSYMELATEDLLLYYEDFEQDFLIFFKDIAEFSQLNLSK